MKTIWIFNQYANTPNFPGACRHYDIGSELLKNGYNVHIFAGSFNHLVHKDSILKSGEKRKIENYEGICFHWLKTLSYRSNGIKRFIGMIHFYFSLLLEVRRFKEEPYFKVPVVIIGSSVHLFSVLAAKTTAKSMKCRFVMEVRDLWPYTFVATGLLPKYHPMVILFGYMERYLYRRADKIVSLLQYANEYIKKYTDPQKVIWIPNSFNIARLTDLEKQIELKLDLDRENTNFMYAGSINLLNKVNLLVLAFEKALSEISYIQLIIIGNGIERKDLEDYVIEKGLTSKIIFKNPVPQLEILHYLKSADALWLGLSDSPLYKYGMSFNKIYDYMAVSKPILLSSSNYNNPVIEANCGLYAGADDIDSLYKIIIELCRMPNQKRDELGQRGHSYLINNFTTEIITQKLINHVLEEVN